MELDNEGNLVIAGGFSCGVVDFDQGPGVVELSSINTTYDDLFVMNIVPPVVKTTFCLS